MAVGSSILGIQDRRAFRISLVSEIMRVKIRNHQDWGDHQDWHVYPNSKGVSQSLEVDTEFSICLRSLLKFPIHVIRQSNEPPSCHVNLSPVLPVHVTHTFHMFLIPLAGVLMRSRTTAAYRAALQGLRRLVPLFNPTDVIGDW